MKWNGPLVLCCVAAFLMPISGGFVSVDRHEAAPGTSAFWGIFGSSEFPLMGPCVVGLLAIAAYVWALCQRRILQVPFLPINFSLALLVVSILVAIPMTEFRSLALVAATQLLASILIYYVTVAVGGRNQGLVTLLLAFLAGILALSALGIFEYQMTKLKDPNWRVFSNTVNPNALAGLLLFGLFGGLSAAFATDRVARTFALLVSILCGTTLYLTQSKGGLLAAAVGFAVWIAFSFWFRVHQTERRKRFLDGVAVLVGIALFTGLVLFQPNRGQPTTPIAGSRVTNYSSQSEQSGTFRKMIWTSAGQLIKTQPFGYGAGSFATQSTRPGLIPMTVTAHQGFLHFAVEFGVHGLLFLLSFLALVLREALRGRPKQRMEFSGLKAGLVAGIAAALAHNFVDSDLQLFGSQSSLFFFLGLLTSASIDGVTPENLFRPIRISAAVMASALGLSMCWTTHIDNQKSILRGLFVDPATTIRNRASLLPVADSLVRLAPYDGEAYAIRFQLADRSELLPLAEKAAQYSPTMKNLRTLAQVHKLDQNYDEAVAALKQALSRDPNNLPALQILFELEMERGGDVRSVMDRIIAVESKPYYTVRAIPEIIPTETAAVRQKYAKTQTGKYKDQLLEEALAIYGEYLTVTAPRILAGLEEDPNFRFGSEGLRQLSEVLTATEDILEVLNTISAIQVSPDYSDEVTKVKEIRAQLEKVMAKHKSQD